MNVDIRRSTVIQVPVDELWAVLRDFNSHSRWHPAVETSRIDGGEAADRVGAVRDFRLKDGSRIREQLPSLRHEAQLWLLHPRGGGAAAPLCSPRPVAADHWRERLLVGMARLIRPASP